MFALLYPWSFIVALAGLLLWSLTQAKKLGSLFRGLFLLGMTGWIISIFTAPIDIPMKSALAVRDLVVLGIAGLAMQWARSNLFTGIGVMVAAAMFVQLTYMDVLSGSFHTPAEIDEHAELLVDLAGQDPQPLIQFVESKGATLHPSFGPGDPEITDLDEYYTIDLKGKAQNADIQYFIQDLFDLNLIDWAEPNEIIRLEPEASGDIENSIQGMDRLVNDPDINRQWGMNNLDIANLYKTLTLKTVRPKKTALVAILDTGVDGKHEDLAQAYVSTKSSYDKDVQGHGTHVAGIVAAVSNNRIGIASFAPDDQFIRVTSIKVLSDRGMGTQEGIIKGMLEAADRGADVISMSLGGRSNAEKEEAYEKAVRYCNDKGAIVVVAAGNSNSDARFYAPAKVDGVIAVSAINRENARAPFSNWVSGLKYGLAAPGDEIYSTFPGNQYRSFRGTSMACPHVSSIVGILKSLEPDLNTQEIYELLKSSGIDSRQPLETGKIIYPAQAVRMLLD